MPARASSISQLTGFPRIAVYRQECDMTAHHRFHLSSSQWWAINAISLGGSVTEPQARLGSFQFGRMKWQV